MSINLTLEGGDGMKKVLAVFMVLSLFFIAGQVMAEKVPTPESFEGITVVTSDWVKSNLDKITVVDARKKGEFVEKHIPGALSIVYKEKSAKTLEFDSSKDKFKLAKYPSDKSATIVVYCNGPKCWKSFKSAILLVRNGYKNVKWLRDGFPSWLEKGYPTE